MINEQSATTTNQQKVEFRHIGRHCYEIWIDGEYNSIVSGRESIAKAREQYPDATIITPR